MVIAINVVLGIILLLATDSSSDISKWIYGGDKVDFFVGWIIPLSVELSIFFYAKNQLSKIEPKTTKISESTPINLNSQANYKLAKENLNNTTSSRTDFEIALKEYESGNRDVGLW